LIDECLFIVIDYEKRWLHRYSYIYHLKNLIKIFGFSLERLEKKQKYV